MNYVKFATEHDRYSSPRVRVPGFQRNYVWPNRKINNFVESIIENDDFFYIGNLLIQEANGAGNPNFIVDGQQRLVTLSLILTAVLNDPEASNSTKKDALNLVYIDHNKPRLSFEKDGADQIYSCILKNKSVEQVKDKSLRSFLTRYKYIRKVIKKFDANELVRKIKNLELVVINCASTHDVISLYQGLNSTGKKLEPAELIKSLISGNSLTGKRLWSKLEKVFFERNPIWLDKFFRHHWFSVKGYISGDQLYLEVKDYLKNNPAYLKEVALLSPIYLDIRDANIVMRSFPWNKMRKNAKRGIQYLLETIRSLRLDQVYAPLLALIKYGNKNSYYLTNDLFFNDLYRIYCFLILFKFSNSNPNKIERIFANFCKNISVSPITKKRFEDVCESLFSDLVKEVPKKELFSEKLIDFIKYSKKEEIGDRQIIESILSAYILEDGVIIPPACDIEHIFPEGDEYSRWNISAEAKHELVDKKLRLTLGNLTLLTPADNKAVKTLSFKDKYVKVYKIDKIFRKNSSLDLYDFGTVDVHKSVERRAGDISDFVYNRLHNKLKC